MTYNENPGSSSDPVPWGNTNVPAPPPPPAPSPPAAPVAPAQTTASPWQHPEAPQIPSAPQPPVIGNAIGGGHTPPPPPASSSAPTSFAAPASPVLSGDYGLTEPPLAPEAPQRSSKLPWVAAVLGALVLLGGGGFFALTAFSASGGAESPEAAVDAMIEALGNEDFVTIGELIEPSERRTMVEPAITELLPELVRLGLLDDEVDPANVEGVDWEFTDVTYRVEPLAQNPDIVHVYFTGGEVASEFNSAEFPFSDLMRDEFGADMEDQARQTEQIEPSDIPLTFVERDGRWYFSAWFSVAEAARLETDARLPRASEAPPALGSESPEAAVEAMFGELVEWDLEGLIGRMDPDEMAALYRYSPLFLTDAQFELDGIEADLRADNYRWSMSDFDFDVETDGDDAIVDVRGFTIDVQADNVDITMTYARDELSAEVIADDFGGRGSLSATTTRWSIEGVIDGESFNMLIEIDPDSYTISGSGSAAGESGEGSITFDFDGECSRYSLSASDGTDESGCLEDSLPTNQDQLALSFYKNSFDDWPTEFPGISMSTRRTDGEWFISPIGTTFDAYLDALASFDDDQLNEFLTSVEEFDTMDAFNDAIDEAIGRDSISPDGDDFDDLFADLDDEGLFDESFDDMMDDEDFEVIESADPVQEGIFEIDVPRGDVYIVDDSLEVGAYDLAYIDLDAGDTVVITVQTDPSSFLDTTLTMFDDSSQEVGFNDDADFEAGLASSLDSQLEVTVGETGTYTIEIGSFAYMSTGEYQLTVERR